jgi:gamma-glutamyl:cysteine ligase YbdK (ATP-grasp superfamily)
VRLEMRIVDLTLAQDDLERIAALLARHGKSLEEGLAWLISEGARHYTNDQKAWEALSAAGTPEGDPRKLELQWREAAAHLLSMRARTLETEARMQALAEQVSAMTAEYKEIRSRLFAMQEERRQLQMLLGGSAPLPTEANARKGLWENLHRLLRGRHG